MEEKEHFTALNRLKHLYTDNSESLTNVNFLLRLTYSLIGRRDSNDDGKRSISESHLTKKSAREN